MQVTEDEIKIARNFFKQTDISVLEKQAGKINTEQPGFTAAIFAMEMHGLERIMTEDLLESIFVVYYVYTELRKIKLNTIGLDQIAKNIKWFESFIQFYNKEKASGDCADLKNAKFLKDDTVLTYAAETLRDLFGTAGNIPLEVVYPYFALLKGIETEAERFQS
jgi:hypothetical protein